ncbi:hypothetical protein BC833DRAFT_608484 [Globomyces pollinis-pini]|nr:hypothetical protein BC833DRAFT_608484 [Globomyces pollinis-pini]
MTVEIKAIGKVKGNKETKPNKEPIKEEVVDSEIPDDSFQLLAFSQQEIYASLLGQTKWFDFHTDEPYMLKNKICFAVFGFPPVDDIDTMDVDDYEIWLKPLYKEAQYESIKSIYNTILQFAKNPFDKDIIRLSIVFIIIDTKAHLPVFRIKVLDECFFVDYSGRLYKSWDLFLLDNKLPGNKFCFPKDGVYITGINSFEILDTPTSSTLNKIMNITDTTTGVTGIVCGVGLIAGFCFPVIAPLVVPYAAFGGAVSGTWGLGRSSYKLVDRTKHNQSIQLNDPDARTLWILTIGNALSFGNSAIAEAGEMVGRFGGLLTESSYNYTNNALARAIVNNCLIEDREPTLIECLEFATTIFFFSHQLINLKIAKDLIHTGQEEALLRRELY